MDQNEAGLQTCRRCYSRESIPTYQFVKFDLREHYLCQRCWEDFRRWFNWGQRPSPSVSSPGSLLARER